MALIEIDGVYRSFFWHGGSFHGYCCYHPPRISASQARSVEAIDKRPLLLVLVKLRRSSNETAPVVRNKHGAVAKARNVVSFLKQKKGETWWNQETLGKSQKFAVEHHFTRNLWGLNP